MFLVPELAPLFGLRNEDLLENFSILTRVLDGQGLSTDSGVHGRPGHTGDYLFSWIGCTTPIEHRVWKNDAQARLPVPVLRDEERGAYSNPGPPEPSTLTLAESLRWLLEGIETELTPCAPRSDQGRLAVVTGLPTPVIADVQRILDRAARRLLAACLDGDAVGPASGADLDALDHSPDQGALLVQREEPPVRVAAQRHGRRGRGL